MYDIKDLSKYIEKKDTTAIKALMKEHNLKVVDGKLKAVDKEQADFNEGFWNQRQQARKILLNS